MGRKQSVWFSRAQLLYLLTQVNYRLSLGHLRQRIPHVVGLLHAVVFQDSGEHGRAVGCAILGLHVPLPVGEGVGEEVHVLPQPAGAGVRA